MAIARGAGTEIIRSAQFQRINDTEEKLIVGIQHHIYTVLSITMRNYARNGTEQGYLKLYTYDVKAGTAGEQVFIAVASCAPKETYVWNEKFSFNGFGPADFGTGLGTDGTNQDALADQGGAYQYLVFHTDSSSTTYDVTITYIDQNNA